MATVTWFTKNVWSKPWLNDASRDFDDIDDLGTGRFLVKEAFVFPRGGSGEGWIREALRPRWRLYTHSNWIAAIYFAEA
jgi:hypothetical protein